MVLMGGSAAGEELISGFKCLYFKIKNRKPGKKKNRLLWRKKRKNPKTEPVGPSFKGASGPMRCMSSETKMNDDEESGGDWQVHLVMALGGGALRRRSRTSGAGEVPLGPTYSDLTEAAVCCFLEAPV